MFFGLQNLVLSVLFYNPKLKSFFKENYESYNSDIKYLRWILNIEIMLLQLKKNIL